MYRTPKVFEAGFNLKKVKDLTQVGSSDNKSVWRFSFSGKTVFIVSSIRGNIMSQFTGTAENLPEIFQDIIRGTTIKPKRSRKYLAVQDNMGLRFVRIT